MSSRILAGFAGLAGLFGMVFSGTPAYADSARDGQWYLGTMNIVEAHNISQGNGITVGVIDSGIDPDHPDLGRNVLPGADFFAQNGDGRIDTGGHGTAMAGLIAAHGSSGNGILGIAPAAKIVPIRDGAGNFPSGRALADGVQWATERKLRVICIATGGSRTAQLDTVIAEAIKSDVLVVAAVGNSPESSSVDYPAAYDGVVAVAGVDRQGNHADVSVTGPEVVIAAPAVDIWSTKAGGGYRSGTGTSDATAIVAGVAALIRSKYPELSARQVIERMTATAVDKGAPGRDDEYGYGVVDPVAALTRELPTASPAQPPASSAPTSRAPAGDRSISPWTFILLGVGVLAVAGGFLAWVLRRRRASG